MIARKTINTLNTKYNVIYAKENKVPLDWEKTCSSIISTIFRDDFRNSKIYNDIYELCMKENINLKTLIIKFETELKTMDQKKSNFIDIVKFYDRVLSRLNYYTSLINYNNIKEDGNNVEYYIYNILTDSIINNSDCDKYVNELTNRLMTEATTIGTTLKILGHIFKNGSIDNNSRSFTVKCVMNVMRLLDNLKTINTKIDIYAIINIINNIGIMFKNDYMENADKMLYCYCYKKCSEELVNKLSCNDDKILYKTLLTLNEIKEYIINDEMVCQITKLFSEVIDNKIKNFKEYKVNTLEEKNCLNYYNTLETILNMSYILLSEWDSNEQLRKTLVDKLNIIFNKDVIIYFNTMIRLQIENNTESNNKINKYTQSLFVLLKLPEFDFSMASYCSLLQTRYIDIMSNNNMSVCKNILDIDVRMHKSINDYVLKNNVLNDHLKNTMEKIKNIIDDFSKSLSTNNILFKLDKTNKTNNTNTSILWTSGAQNWSELSKEIGYNFNIKYNDDIMKTLIKAEELNNKKNPLYKIKWLNDNSTLILNYLHDNKTYNIKLTLLQSSVLLLFGNIDKLKLEDIYNSLLSDKKDDSKNEYIKRACDSLVSAKILKKNVEMYEINDELKLSDNYIKSERNKNAANIAKFFFKKQEVIKPIEKKEIISVIEYDRANTIKCYIMKCVKNLPNYYYSFDEIALYIESELKLFQFNRTDIQNNIKGLVKSYYLDENKNTFRYEQE